MLSISEELSNFSSIDMEGLEQKIGKMPDDMRHAIELYNKALDDIGNKNEDIAIIALKKAIAIYPAFYEAMNLMGMCFLSLNDEENARIMFNRVIKMDDNSIRALHYLDEMDGDASSESGKSKPAKAKKANKNQTGGPSLVAWVGSGLTAEKQPYFFKYVLGFVLGILAMCLVWLFIPEGKPIVFDFNKPYSESAQLSNLKNENQTLTTRLSEANQALEKANQNQKQLQDQMDQYVKWSATLRDLQNLADKGKYKEVVIQIDQELAGLELPKQIEDEIIKLNNTCKPKAVQQFYDSGRQLYASNATAKDPEVYKQSADAYKMAIKIIEELQLKPSNMAEIYYYGGKAIALSKSPSEKEAESEAIRCFSSVISVAPGSKLASYAQARINELESGATIRH